jgi:hypothetical protein
MIRVKFRTTPSRFSVGALWALLATARADSGSGRGLQVCCFFAAPPVEPFALA